MSYTESLQKIRAARTDRDTVKDNLYTLQLQYLTLKKQQQKELTRRIGEEQQQLSSTIRDQTKFVADKSDDLDRLKGQIADAIGTSKEKNRLLSDTINELFIQLTPQQLIEQWNDDIPIMLL